MWPFGDSARRRKRLTNIDVEAVDPVDNPGNARAFLIVKNADSEGGESMGKEDKQETKKIEKEKDETANEEEREEAMKAKGPAAEKLSEGLKGILAALKDEDYKAAGTRTRQLRSHVNSLSIVKEEAEEEKKVEKEEEAAEAEKQADEEPDVTEKIEAAVKAAIAPLEKEIKEIKLGKKSLDGQEDEEDAVEKRIKASSYPSLAAGMENVRSQIC